MYPFAKTLLPRTYTNPPDVHSAARISPLIGGGSKDAPIDLTYSPPKMRPNKRGAPEDFEQPSTQRAQKVQKLNASPKKEKAQETAEKRLRRWRDHAPMKYHFIRSRALTQRLFVLDRERDLSDPDHPIEIVTMAGTTGNVYSVVIDKIPSCDCPHAIQGNQCKHIIYVLSQVLRVRRELEYQAAFLSSELHEIFAQAPPLPSEKATDSADGTRKPLDGECPICCEDFDLKNTKEKVVYCKAACGNNIHAECFDRWAETKADGHVTCPMCRTPWAAHSESTRLLAKTGYMNSEGYINVASQLGLSGIRDFSSYNRYGMRHWEEDWY